MIYRSIHTNDLSDLFKAGEFQIAIEKNKGIIKELDLNLLILRYWAVWMMRSI